MALVTALSSVFVGDFTVEDTLESHGYATKRSINPRNFDPNDPGGWIYEVRSYYDLSAGEFGRKISRTGKAIEENERGKFNPTVESLRGIYVEYVEPLFDGDSDPNYFSFDDILDKFQREPAYLRKFSKHLPIAFDVAQQATQPLLVDGGTFQQIYNTAAVGLMRSMGMGRGHSIAGEVKRFLTAHLQGGLPPTVTPSEAAVLDRIELARAHQAEELGQAPSPTQVAAMVPHVRTRPGRPRRILGRTPK